MENSQKIRKKYNSALDAARVYYGVLSALNGLKLTSKQLTFLAYVATAREASKEEYISLYNSRETRANTLIYNLRKKGLILKQKTLQLTPALAKLNFENPLTLTINMETHETR